MMGDRDIERLPIHLQAIVMECRLRLRVRLLTGFGLGLIFAEAARWLAGALA